MTVFATFVCLAVLPRGVAMADTVATGFEGFTLGSVNGQDGWRSGSNIDEGVVSSGGVPTFGDQSLRISNLNPSSGFTDQTYSSAAAPPAGENQPNTVYIAKFSFLDQKFQPGLELTVSPDSGNGGRMAWVDLLDTEQGVKVTGSDSSGTDGNFVDYPLGLLTHGQPHTIEFQIKLIPGEANDRVRILVDGQDAGQCYTTWETYYRDAEQHQPPNINSLEFRTSVKGFTQPGGGYLFDNVAVTTGTGPDTPGCDVTLDKQADAATVTAGGLAGYKLTARNRGRAVARHIRVCDHIPRGTTFVRADRKLQRVGSKRCLMIASLKPGQRESVHVELRVDGDHPLGTFANIADLRPGLPGTAAPPGADLPALPASPAPGTPAAKIKAIKRARAIVKVVARRRARRPPGVTG